MKSHLTNPLDEKYRKIKVRLRKKKILDFFKFYKLLSKYKEEKKDEQTN